MAYYMKEQGLSYEAAMARTQLDLDLDVSTNEDLTDDTYVRGVKWSVLRDRWKAMGNEKFDKFLKGYQDSDQELVRRLR